MPAFAELRDVGLTFAVALMHPAAPSGNTALSSASLGGQISRPSFAKTPIIALWLLQSPDESFTQQRYSDSGWKIVQSVQA
ncbi:hypothetical protein [Paraburkholderia sp. 40]|uniref:hypothetical protein n=1 Tax=Paraburkholderia sp. 40 TaxID=2991059 RepID=UPI003D23F040